MASSARKRTFEVQGKTSQVEARKAVPLKMTLLGREVVLDVFSLSIAEKQKWRGYLADLGQFADEADHMMALATVIIQRDDPGLTWESAKEQITWQSMLDAVAAATDAEANHPNG